MSKKFLFPYLVFALSLCACQILSGFQRLALTETPPGSVVDEALLATLHELSGGVLVRQPQQEEFVPGADGVVLELSGQVSTQEDGRARLDLSTGSVIRLSPLTIFTLQSNEATSQGSLLTRFKLELGKVWVILRGGQVEVETSSGVTSVRGSYLSVEILSGGQLIVTCLEGVCQFENAAGSVSLTDGQKAIVDGPQDLPQAEAMNEQDFQEWLEVPEAIPFIPTKDAQPLDVQSEESEAVSPCR